MSIEVKNLISSPDDSPVRLSGNMGAFSLMLTVLAFSAPLTTVSGYIPVSLVFGGIASPLIFMMVTAVILIFAVGYISLNDAVKRPGDFYAFISFGLGKSVGLGSGFMAAVSYFLLLAGVASFFGVSCAELHRSLTGFAMPWYAYTLICWFAVAVMGYLNVELSAKVLTWVMFAEIIICLAFVFGVFGSAETQPMGMSPFFPSELTGTGIHVPFAMLFAVSFFMGFEATALFRDEVAMPEKTIPRATYGAIISIGLLYTICVYALIKAYGADIQSVATANPAGMFSLAFANFISPRFHLLLTLLVLTSSFACVLSIHNVLSRYLHNLATDGALPVVLKKVHVRHASPYIASLTVSSMVLLVLLPFIVTGVKPEVLYGQLSGVGTAGVIMLMTLVCLSSIIYFLRERTKADLSFSKLFLAPLISASFFIWLVFLVVKNFEMLVGGEPGERRWMLYSLMSVVAIGAIIARYFKARKPEVFLRLGRTYIS